MKKAYKFLFLSLLLAIFYLFAMQQPQSQPLRLKEIAAKHVLMQNAFDKERIGKLIIAVDLKNYLLELHDSKYAMGGKNGFEYDENGRLWQYNDNGSAYYWG